MKTIGNLAIMKALFLRELLFLSILFSAFSLGAQSRTDSLAAFPLVRFQYSYLLPAGDYESTFGNTNLVGGAIAFKTKTNWQFELEANYMFGANVKRKTLLSGIVNAAGDATDVDGELVRVLLDIRGYTFFASAGRIFPISKTNPNSGILIQGGIGYLQHRIKVDFRDGEVFQLSDDMLKGYDRLHTGVAFKQFIGYQYFGKKNLINFFAGFEFNQGLTYNRRGYNYDTQSFDEDQKFDFLYGFRVGWSMPIRGRASEEFYYY